MRSEREIHDAFLLLLEVGQAYGELHDEGSDEHLLITAQLSGVMGALAWMLGIPTPVEQLIEMLRMGKDNNWQDDQLPFSVN